jgi:hypothetical protein
MKIGVVKNHTLLNAAYEIWPEFSTFFPSELKKKIITENVHKSIYCIVSFVKIVTMKIILRTYMNFFLFVVLCEICI